MRVGPRGPTSVAGMSGTGVFMESPLMPRLPQKTAQVRWLCGMERPEQAEP